MRILVCLVACLAVGCAVDPVDGDPLDDSEQSLGNGIVASPSALEFGIVLVGQKRTLPVTLTNTSKTSLQCNANLTDDLALSLSVGWISELAPGKSVTIDVTYRPTKPNLLDSSIYLDDGTIHTVTVPARGSAK